MAILLFLTACEMVSKSNIAHANWSSLTPSCFSFTLLLLTSVMFRSCCRSCSSCRCRLRRISRASASMLAPIAGGARTAGRSPSATISAHASRSASRCAMGGIARCTGLCCCRNDCVGSTVEVILRCRSTIIIRSEVVTIHGTCPILNQTRIAEGGISWSVIEGIRSRSASRS
jgi:hypothetical protein